MGKNNAHQFPRLFAFQRFENQWSIKDILNQKAKDFEIKFDDNISSKNLITKLQDQWDDFERIGSKVLEGRVKCILPNNRSGFITIDDSREDIYFNSRNCNFAIAPDLVDSLVTFTVTDTFDMKKNKQSKQAINITKKIINLKKVS